MFPLALSPIFSVFLGKWRGLAFALIAGAAVGAWTTWKVCHGIYRAQEASAYQEQIARLKSAQAASQTALVGMYEDKLRIAKGRVTREEIVKLVPADCQLGDVIGLLNSHRAGMPLDTGTTDR